VIEDLSKARLTEIFTGIEVGEYRKSREEFEEKARRESFQTFAVVKDGKWYEKGEMGWWGIVTNETDDWSTKFSELIEGLSPETFLAVVDCHI
jgi:hypothetical protein